MIGTIGTRSTSLALRSRLFPTAKLLHPRHFASDNPGEKPISLWYPIVGGLVITIGGGIKWWHDHVGGPEGLKRSAHFYSYAIPKYLVYRYHVWRKSPDEVWEALDNDTSKGGLKKIQDLRGFYIKAGQMAAANVGDGFPEIWQKTMSVLQDQCPEEDFETIKAIVSKELDFDSVFATFEERPIGAASIGQVHRATLKDGTRVVVKVMYPSAEELLRGDVRTIKAFAQIAQPVHVPALEQIEVQYMEEFDYRAEAKHLATVRDNLIAAGLAGKDAVANQKLCLVPKPYLDLCTKRVLVMEELLGDKLADALKQEQKALANRTGESVEAFTKRIKAEEEEAKAKGEQLHGPSSSDYDLLISVLDSKRKTTNALRMLYNTTIGLLPGTTKKELEDKSTLPINHAKMIDDLIYIHGHEVLVDGYFNGDPHPGNILLVRGQDGRPGLGLIDYGSTKQLSKEKRHLFCKLVIALANEDREAIVSLMKEAGWKSKRMDPNVIYLFAKVSYDEDNYKLTEGMHIQLFVEELQARDPINEMPKDFIMIYQTSIRLRGLAHALHQPRSLAKAWKPIAERVLREDL
ncbi:protein kinase UbiB [Seminavis robusta]|uniref:Protein kinase UbiB n=1 Tax=Seminavis robusta TaxID=568900 RepID=A0A9N8H0N0_9STRA|nr:protein kinase UbiB [Seminavis robusta]|eukprot:Sro23_g016070.1 protein kinase UbiB (576) ;mRNA; r:144272-146629